MKVHFGKEPKYIRLEGNDIFVSFNSVYWIYCGTLDEKKKTLNASRKRVEEMKNKEKFEKEIVEIACDGNDVAVRKSTGKPIDCCDIECGECSLLGDKSCTELRREWAESKYIEKPVISKRDRAFLEYLNANINYIARNMDGSLYAYISKPYKIIDCWCSDEFEKSKSLRMVDIDLPMVKWSDDSSWLIEDLKKLEVVEEYDE